jgi:hypothetical protein
MLMSHSTHILRIYYLLQADTLFTKYLLFFKTLCIELCNEDSFYAQNLVLRSSRALRLELSCCLIYGFLPSYKR